MAGRLLAFAAVLLLGALLFRRFEPDKDLSLVEATYYTFSLVFAEPPEAFPRAPVLRVMFFVMPVLGLTVIFESIVELALLLRDRRRFERSWCLMMASSMSNHIILCGVGRLGFRIFRLLRRLGEPVAVIERDAANPFIEQVRREGSPLLVGDARLEHMLVEANLASARSVIVATNDDLANLEIALDARRLKPGIRLVVRMFDQNLADKIRDGFNIQTAMSQSAMSAPAFAMSALDAAIVSSTVVGDELVVMRRWRVEPRGPFDGRTVGQVMSAHGCAIAELRRGGDSPRLFPPPDTALAVGDDVLVQGRMESIRALAGVS